ncbi:DgyrCDS1327 [Dimorphilus gyrociliatus]|uniref:RNA helicase n=1 Tax=Dimorphilus gyrociliatus TaxID=2664684 RepID=A0A7I8V6Y1_9ANNE|nr:DgyrCDS1327 [Dimorphilus gyrociliatus]
MEDIGWNDESEYSNRTRRGRRGGFSQRSNFGWGNSGGYSKENFVSEHYETEESDKYPVPGRFLGRIIGKGGSKIRELQESSGARLTICKDEYEGEFRNISLNGTEEQIEKAKCLIEEVIKYAESQPHRERERNTSYNARGNTNNVSRVGERTMIDWSVVHANKDKLEAEKWEDSLPMKKDFYFEDPDIASMTREEVRTIRRQNNNIQIDFMGDEEDLVDIPNPIINFDQAFKHYPGIMTEIEKAGFTEPSPIQKQSWPILLKGLDLIGIAQTGTGKTLAFLLPAFIHIDNQPTPREERGGANVLVLSPTRELALQIENEVKKYNYKNISCVCVYGGGNRKDQIKIVTKGVQIIVATPGRLNDLIEAKFIDVKSVTYLVLDEADRMLDMGFEPDIRKVLLDIRPDRQTVMTSATWPENVRRLAKQYMKNPVTCFVGSLDLAAVHSVEQEIRIIDEDEKRCLLLNFIHEERKPDEKVIVFVGRKTVADDIASDFALQGIYCQSLHGDRDQSDREQALLDLKEGNVSILIATDVASRGIDIKDISYVLNYDFPRHIEEYVHRVGRTGRAGRRGKSITFMTRNDWARAAELIDILEEAEQLVPDQLRSMADRFSIMRERKREKRFNERRTVNELSLAGSKDGRRRGGAGGAGAGGNSGYGRGRGIRRNDNFSMFSF